MFAFAIVVAVAVEDYRVERSVPLVTFLRDTLYYNSVNVMPHDGLTNPLGEGEVIVPL